MSDSDNFQFSIIMSKIQAIMHSIIETEFELNTTGLISGTTQLVEDDDATI